ncbi:hypothetical protein ABZ307_06935 [Streptomyces griseorubiginosus]|uniref:hypothetical protein n=1 Tax=Streptomyces griseorubiginosus TaxID=67304 RepID=UPI0033AD3903
MVHLRSFEWVLGPAPTCGAVDPVHPPKERIRPTYLLDAAMQTYLAANRRRPGQRAHEEWKAMSNRLPFPPPGRVLAAGELQKDARAVAEGESL